MKFTASCKRLLNAFVPKCIQEDARKPGGGYLIYHCDGEQVTTKPFIGPYIARNKARTRAGKRFEYKEQAPRAKKLFSDTTHSLQGTPQGLAFQAAQPRLRAAKIFHLANITPHKIWQAAVTQPGERSFDVWWQSELWEWSVSQWRVFFMYRHMMLTAHYVGNHQCKWHSSGESYEAENRWSQELHDHFLSFISCNTMDSWICNTWEPQMKKPRQREGRKTMQHEGKKFTPHENHIIEKLVKTLMQLKHQRCQSDLQSYYAASRVLIHRAFIQWQLEIEESRTTVVNCSSYCHEPRTIVANCSSCCHERWLAVTQVITRLSLPQQEQAHVEKKRFKHCSEDYEPCIDVEIASTKMQAFPDTGASYNFITVTTMEKLGLGYHRQYGERILLPDGRTMESLGTVKAAIQFCGERCPQTIEFHVLEQCVHDVVLCSSFLLETDTLTTHYNRRIYRRLKHDQHKAIHYMGAQRTMAGRLNGLPVSAVPDTGASHNIISASYAMRRGLKIDTDIDHRIPFQLADGSTVCSQGAITNLEFQYNVSSTQSFECGTVYIIDGLHCDMLLSFEFLHTTGALGIGGLLGAEGSPSQDLMWRDILEIVGFYTIRMGNPKTRPLEDTYLVQKRLLQRQIEVLEDQTKDMTPDQRQARLEPLRVALQKLNSTSHGMAHPSMRASAWARLLARLRVIKQPDHRGREDAV